MALGIPIGECPHMTSREPVLKSIRGPHGTLKMTETCNPFAKTSQSAPGASECFGVGNTGLYSLLWHQFTKGPE